MKKITSFAKQIKKQAEEKVKSFLSLSIELESKHVLFFENGTKIANLVSHNHKGMTSEPSQESEKIFFA